MKSRLNLVKYSNLDFHFFSSLVCNETVMNMNMGRSFTEDEAHEFFAYALDTSEKHSYAGLYKAYTNENGTYIGTAILRVNQEKSSSEIEYMLLPEYWGYGYGTEIAAMLLELAVMCKGINEITAITVPENMASKRVLVKNGFVFEKKYKVEETDSWAELFTKKL